jgi:hypothetical protein
MPFAECLVLLALPTRCLCDLIDVLVEIGDVLVGFSELLLQSIQPVYALSARALR